MTAEEDDLLGWLEGSEEEGSPKTETSAGEGALDIASMGCLERLMVSSTAIFASL